MGLYYDIATCRDCGTKQKVYHKQWIRASRPRCVACGGTVEASEKAKKEHSICRMEKTTIKTVKIRQQYTIKGARIV